MADKITQTLFGHTSDGTPVHCFTLTNAVGAQVMLLDYGARIHQFLVPDREGRLENVTRSYETMEQYEASRSCAGAICGPVANRISGAAFELNGIRYSLEQNNGRSNLHSGSTGFHRQVWQGKAVGSDRVRFFRRRPDGEGGFPGEMQVQVLYTWSDDCSLTMDYEAVCDRDTLCNFTNHAYWNLGGYGRANPLDQWVQIPSNRYTEITADVTPTGVICTSEPELDLRTPKQIGPMLKLDAAQLKSTGEFGHTYVLPDDGRLKLAAELTSRESGRRLRVWTTCPGILLYSGYSSPDFPENGHTGVALEAQRYPDAMRHPQFPSIVLPAGQRYRERTVYQFTVTARHQNSSPG